MVSIVTVSHDWQGEFNLHEMSYIRWLSISQALARFGHTVDMATSERRWGKRPEPVVMGENLRRVDISKVDWSDYDVVKTLFHAGFDALESNGGGGHRFIISKLGSVVGSHDMDGIYFYGDYRRRLYATQERIDQTGRYITLLSEPAAQLWQECFGIRDNLLIVPGATEKYIPEPGADPYPKGDGVRCLFAGNVYNEDSQGEANRTIIGKLNALGRLLAEGGGRLYMMGFGDVSALNQKYVTYLGVVPYERTWDYFRHADVGVVVSAGKFMHNNESTKIYHYLRVGLPVVSESGFPNDNVVRESRLGYVVDSGDIKGMAARVLEASTRGGDRERAVRYILENHTWDRRAEVYDRLIRKELG